MQPRGHHRDYDEETTACCERALVTLLGDVGPWRERLYLAGGLAPRYLVGSLPEGAAPHVGTTDVDLVVGVALDDAPETYRTLHNNLRRAQFEQQEPSFAWSRSVDGVTVTVELLCETTEVEAGAIFRPKDGTGAKVSAFNVRGAMLARRLSSSSASDSRMPVRTARAPTPPSSLRTVTQPRSPPNDASRP